MSRLGWIRRFWEFRGGGGLAELFEVAEGSGVIAGGRADGFSMGMRRNMSTGSGKWDVDRILVTGGSLAEPGRRSVEARSGRAAFRSLTYDRDSSFSLGYDLFPIAVLRWAGGPMGSSGEQYHRFDAGGIGGFRFGGLGFGDGGDVFADARRRQDLGRGACSGRASSRFQGC